MISSASHHGRNVASAGGDRREQERDHEERHQRRPDREADADPERRDLLLQLEARELELQPRDRRGVLGDLLRRSADAAVRLLSRRGWA